MVSVWLSMGGMWCEQTSGGMVFACGRHLECSAGMAVIGEGFPGYSDSGTNSVLFDASRRGKKMLNYPRHKN